MTRRIRNPNRCHTLNAVFREELANYEVATALRKDDLKLVVLIESVDLLQLRAITRETIRAHETALSLALLDRALLPGFAAAKLLYARDLACSVLCQGCSCGSDPAPAAAGTELAAAVTKAHELVAAATKINRMFIRFPMSVLGASLGVGSEVDDVKRYLFRKTLQANAPQLIQGILAVGITEDLTAPISVQQIQALATVVATVSSDSRPKLVYDEKVSTDVSNEIFGYIISSILILDPIGSGIMLGAVKSQFPISGSARQTAWWTQ